MEAGAALGLFPEDTFLKHRAQSIRFQFSSLSFARVKSWDLDPVDKPRVSLSLVGFSSCFSDLIALYLLNTN